MTVRVRLFAAFREVAGTEALDLPAPEGLTVGQVWAQLVGRYPDLGAWPPSAAVNRSYVDHGALLTDGDEVAFLPPVSGG